MPTMDISELATWGPDDFKRWGAELRRRRLALTKTIGYVSLSKVGGFAGVTNTTVGEAEKGKPKELKTVVGIMDALDNLERQARAARGEPEPAPAEPEAKVLPLPTQTVAAEPPEQVSETEGTTLLLLREISTQLAAIALVVEANAKVLAELQARPDPAARKSRQQ